MGEFINFNGEIYSSKDFSLQLSNRTFKYGDGIFETIRYSNNKLYFFEDHYFRAMGSMCMLRMEIPNALNMEYMHEEVIKTIKENSLDKDSCRIRIQFSRKDGGLYTPKTNSVDFYIEVEKLEDKGYTFNPEGLSSDIFFDHTKAKNELSSLKSNNSIPSVVASIFAQENSIDQAFLLNTENEIIETQNSNIFVFKDNKVYAPGADKGAVDGIIRKQLLKILENEKIEIVTDKIRAYELNTAEEVLVTNAISGIQFISNFREKKYTGNKAEHYLKQLSTLARLAQ